MDLAIVFVCIGVSLMFYLVPAFLARQRIIDDANEHFVATRETKSSIFTNAAVAYQLQMATFGPFFVWGALGDYWPGIINTVFLCIGLIVIVIFRHPIIDFMRNNLRGSESITLHGFISSAHGSARSVRLVSSLFTVFALWGIVIGEMYGVTAVISPILNNSKQGSYIIVTLMLFFMFIYTTTGGNDGVQRADQFQLGVAYTSLFGALAIMLSTIVFGGVVSVSLIIAVALLSISLLILFYRRRLRFIDSSVRSIADDQLLSDRAMRRLAQIYKASESWLNRGVLTAALVSLVACLGLLATHLGTLADATRHIDRIATSPTSPVALIALAVLPLVYQICDISNWQRIAALRPDLESEYNPEDTSNTLKSLWGYAIEAPAVWIILMIFGTVAAAYMGGLSSSDPVGGFVTKLLSTHSFVADSMLALFLLACFAISLSTMDAVLSATLYAFRYDILFKTHSGEATDKEEPARVRYTNLFGMLSYLVAVGGLYVAQEFFPAFGAGEYLTILIAVYSAQIAFAPLIIGGILGRKRPEGFWNAGPGGAIAVLLAGFSASLGITFLGIATKNADLGWYAVIACLIVSVATYLAACTTRLVTTRTKNKRGSRQAQPADDAGKMSEDN